MPRARVSAPLARIRAAGEQVSPRLSSRIDAAPDRIPDTGLQLPLIHQNGRGRPFDHPARVGCTVQFLGLVLHIFSVVCRSLVTQRS